MEVGISFLCVWRVDRVSLGHGGVDLVKESPSIWKNKFAASPSLADPASSGMWADASPTNHGSVGGLDPLLSVLYYTTYIPCYVPIGS